MSGGGQFPAGARPKQRLLQDNQEFGDHNFALDTGAAANRRRKKRPGGGLRTVDVLRGRAGFGFTLSGQNPCILSSVIAGSPAERVGLQSGNCLLAVNGQNVARLPHHEVVKIISLCPASIRVQVGDTNNYNPEPSSSEEEDNSKARAKLNHRRAPVRREARPLAELSTNQARDLWLLNNQAGPSRVQKEPDHHQSDTESQCRDRTVLGARHVRSNSADSSFVDINQQPPGSSSTSTSPKKVNYSQKRVELNAMEELNIGSDLNNFFNHNLSELRKSIKLHNHRKLNVDVSSAEYKCVVGYLGTIEMPEGISQSGGGLAEIRNCIRRLRVEKKVHTLVLLCIFPSQVVLINHHGLKLAVFQAENIQFCGVYNDDRRFFGLVTSQPREEAEGGGETNSSCHVFMVEQVSTQSERQLRARTFLFDQSGAGGDPAGAEDVQFPPVADPILNVIYKLRGLSPSQDGGQPGEAGAAAVAQDAASTSSSNSSNSDSGIGYRDEALQPQGTDRALVVDVQNERIRLQNLTRPGHNVSMSSSEGSLPHDVRSLPRATTNMSPPPAPGSSSKLTVRAMPDPSPASPDSSFNTDRLESLQSAEHIRQSMQKYLADKHEHLKKTSQLLADKTGGNPGQQSDKTVSQSVSSRPTSFVRSLEDLRSVDTGSVYSTPDLDLGPPSLPANPHLPLARFLYSSDSNLSQLEVPPLDLANHPLTKWQEAQGSYSKTVLRPCDQYPELGVVKRRDRSAASSTHSYRASVHVESSEYDSLSWRGGTGMTQHHHSLQRKHKVTGQEFDRMSFTEEKKEGGGTLGRKRERRKSDSASIMADQVDMKSITGSQGASDPTKDVGRVASWAADFDKLLQDPAGLQTFAEFLKKEFSHENIYFWCACEKYKTLESGADRLKFAKEVMERHLESGASEPVNVDSVANSSTQDRLSLASSDSPPDLELFKPAQTQIYNLMKFDSFSRFLKSDLYKDSLLADMAGNPLPFNGEDVEVDLLTSALDLDKSDSSIKKSGAGEGGRRKSILPWNNMRNRSKSKDRAEQNTSTESKPAAFIKKLTGQNSGEKVRQSLSSSELKSESNLSSGDPLNHSSESCDNKDSCTLTRFILPDRATTVVSTPSGENIRSLVSRLLEKRGLKFTSFDAFITGVDKPLDLSDDCSTLGCSEVRVEPRVLFRLELPSKKSIGVKAKQTKLVEEVLGPILAQYGWSLADMVVRQDQARASAVDLRASVTTIDSTRLVVSPRDGVEEHNDSQESQESIRSDSRPNSRSSLTMGPRRASSSSVDSRKTVDDSMMPPPKIIPLGRRRPPLPTPGTGGSKETEGTDLYEGLKRMTRGRLDDQRGLEINGELPDFLKKESRAQERYRHLDSRASEPFRQDQARSELRSRLSGPAGFGLPSDWDRDHAKNYIDYIDSTFTSEGHVPNMAEAEEVFPPVNPDESLNFNESRLSLGMGRLSMGSLGGYNTPIDGMRLVTRPSIGAVRDYEGVMMGKPRDYEMLQKLSGGGNRPGLRTPVGGRGHSGLSDYEGVQFKTRKDYEHLSFRPGQPPSVAPKPRLSSVDEDKTPSDSLHPRRPPPPLPPKPVRGPPPLPPHAQHLHNNFGKPHPPAPPGSTEHLPMGVTRTKNGVYLGMPGEKGYNVSFV